MKIWENGMDNVGDWETIVNSKGTATSRTYGEQAYFRSECFSVTISDCLDIRRNLNGRRRLCWASNTMSCLSCLARRNRRSP